MSDTSEMIGLLKQLNGRDVHRERESKAAQDCMNDQIAQLRTSVEESLGAMDRRLGKLETIQDVVGAQVAAALKAEREKEAARREEDLRQMRRMLLVALAAALIVSLVCIGGAWMTFHSICNDIQGAMDAVDQANSLAQRIYEQLNLAYEPVQVKTVQSVMSNVMNSLAAAVMAIGAIIIGVMVLARIIFK